MSKSSPITLATILGSGQQIERTRLQGQGPYGRLPMSEEMLLHIPAIAHAAGLPQPNLQPNPNLSDDTRLWAALQRASGGVWAGCVYDVDMITRVIEAGLSALNGEQ